MTTNTNESNTDTIIFIVINITSATLLVCTILHISINEALLNALTFYNAVASLKELINANPFRAKAKHVPNNINYRAIIGLVINIITLLFYLAPLFLIISNLLGVALNIYLELSIHSLHSLEGLLKSFKLLAKFKF
jgi:hypothetical protein